MIFLTVGTIFPFDRLVHAIDLLVGEGVIEDEIFAQIGCSCFEPQNMEHAEFLDKKSFLEKVDKATGLISHAGMGSITLALEQNKPLLVMPRRKTYKEHVNDHQVATARRFGELGHVLVADDVKDLPVKLKCLESFVPRRRETQVQTQAVVTRIKQFLAEVGAL